MGTFQGRGRQKVQAILPLPGKEHYWLHFIKHNPHFIQPFIVTHRGTPQICVIKKIKN